MCKYNLVKVWIMKNMQDSRFFLAQGHSPHLSNIMRIYGCSGACEILNGRHRRR
jgi:hypothetical protein